MTDRSFPPDFVPISEDETRTRAEGRSVTVSEIVALAWDDETSFDAIEAQTGLSEDEVIQIMRTEVKPSSFRMWRKRVSGRASKHRSK